MKKGLFWLTLAGLCAFALTSCRARAEDPAQNALTAAQTGALKTALLEAPEGENEKNSAQTVPEKQPVDDVTSQLPEESEQEDVCYYTDGGSVWHLDPACSYIANSSGVKSSTVQQAQASGKTRPCARCGD